MPPNLRVRSSPFLHRKALGEEHRSTQTDLPGYRGLPTLEEIEELHTASKSLDENGVPLTKDENGIPLDLIPAPDVRQDDHFSCGAMVTAAAAGLFGVGPGWESGKKELTHEEKEAWKSALGTNEKTSTKPSAIVQYLRELGLSAEPHYNMAIADLVTAWKEGKPVICCIQEYGVPSKQASFLYGHYVLVIGVALGHVFVQDPSIDNALNRPGGSIGKTTDPDVLQTPGRSMIPLDVWEEGWHDKDADGNKYIRFGIAVGPGEQLGRKALPPGADKLTQGSIASQATPPPVTGNPKAEQLFESEGEIPSEAKPDALEGKPKVKPSPFLARWHKAFTGKKPDSLGREQCYKEGEHVSCATGAEQPEPPTTQSAQQPKQKQTETPEFKKWFGDSKVLDAQGKPLVMHHGTVAGAFNTFEPRTSLPMGGMGFWFVEDPDVAHRVAMRKGDETAIMPVYLSIRNPKVLKQGLRDLVNEVSPKGEVTREKVQAYRKKLEEEGYDGIMLPLETADGGRSTQYIAFHPTQIKSASGNAGTFDPTDPDITKSLPQTKAFTGSRRDTAGRKRCYAGGKPISCGGGGGGSSRSSSKVPKFSAGRKLPKKKVRPGGTPGGSPAVLPNLQPGKPSAGKPKVKPSPFAERWHKGLKSGELQGKPCAEHPGATAASSGCVPAGRVRKPGEQHYKPPAKPKLPPTLGERVNQAVDKARRILSAAEAKLTVATDFVRDTRTWIGSKLNQFNEAVKKRYGEQAAKGILATGTLMGWASLPVTGYYIPGATAWFQLPAIALAETLLQGKRLAVGKALEEEEWGITPEQAEQIWTAFSQQFATEYADYLKEHLPPQQQKGMKSGTHEGEPCQQGWTSTRTGCTPAEGEAVTHQGGTSQPAASTVQPGGAEAADNTLKENGLSDSWEIADAEGQTDFMRDVRGMLDSGKAKLVMVPLDKLDGAAGDKGKSEQYAEAMKGGAKFPVPSGVLMPNGRVWMADGNHRAAGWGLNDHSDVPMVVMEFGKSMSALTTKQIHFYKSFQGHSYGCLMANLSGDSAREIREWAKDNILPHHRTDSGVVGKDFEPHLTLLYGFTESTKKQLQEIKALLSQHGPIHAHLKNLALFRGGEDGDVLHVEIESADCVELNRLLKDRFPHVTTHPVYHCHLTLAYLDPNFATAYTAMKPTFLNRDVVITEVEWSSADGKGEIISLTQGEKSCPSCGHKSIQSDGHAEWCAVPPCEWSRKYLTKAADPVRQPHQPTLAVDFDGRIAKVRPDRDLSKTELREGAREALRKFHHAGLRIIVWTSRDDLEDLGEWMHKQDAVYDYINENPTQPTDSRKVMADFYIDDRGEGDPETPWSELEKMVFARLVTHKQPIQQGEGYKELRQKAEAALPEFEELLGGLGLPSVEYDTLDESLEDVPGSFVVMGPIKEEERATDKVYADYNGDWSNLFDVIRASVSADTMEELWESVDKLKAAGAIYARPLKDRFAEPLPNGYSDVLANYRLPSGVIAEVQFHLKPFLRAREADRENYNLLREAGADNPARLRAWEQSQQLFGEAHKAARGNGLVHWCAEKPCDFRKEELNIRRTKGGSLKGKPCSEHPGATAARSGCIPASGETSSQRTESPAQSEPTDTAAADYKQNGVRSKAFKNWFGDWEADPENSSKVVDNSGKPKETHKVREVFHGTGGSFHAFDENLAGVSLVGEGFYFAENRKIAEVFARERGGDRHGKILRCYLNIRKPFDFDRERIPQEELSQWADAAIRMGEAKGYADMDDVKNDYDNDPGGADVPYDSWNADNVREYLAEGGYNGQVLWKYLSRVVGRYRVNILLTKMGYDGIVHRADDINGSPAELSPEQGGADYGRVWIAFKAPQIKSAVQPGDPNANEGTFDPSNPDMRKGLSTHPKSKKHQITVQALAEKLRNGAAPKPGALDKIPGPQQVKLAAALYSGDNSKLHPVAKEWLANREKPPESPQLSNGVKSIASPPMVKPSPFMRTKEIGDLRGKPCSEHPGATAASSGCIPAKKEESGGSEATEAEKIAALTESILGGEDLATAELDALSEAQKKALLKSLIAKAVNEDIVYKDHAAPAVVDWIREQITGRPKEPDKVDEDELANLVSDAHDGKILPSDLKFYPENLLAPLALALARYGWGKATRELREWAKTELEAMGEPVPKETEEEPDHEPELDLDALVQGIMDNDISGTAEIDKLSDDMKKELAERLRKEDMRYVDYAIRNWLKKQPRPPKPPYQPKPLGEAAQKCLASVADSAQYHEGGALRKVALANNMTQGEVKEALDRAFANAELTMNFDPNRHLYSDSGDRITMLDSLLEEPRLKNLAETKTGGGETDQGIRDGWERANFGWSVTDTPAEHRPKYGAINWDGGPDGGAATYGDCVFVLKKEAVMDRTTTTPDNSSGTDIREASPLSNFYNTATRNARALRAAGLKPDRNISHGSYQEFQVWGDLVLNTENIEKIRVPDWIMNDNITRKKLEKLAELTGLTVEEY